MTTALERSTDTSLDSPGTMDAAAWDAFVADGEPASYLQLSGWAVVKAVNGWTHERLITDAGGDVEPVGAQLLIRRPRPLPWAFAYAPRGPVTRRWTPESVASFTDLVRTTLRATDDRVSHLHYEAHQPLGRDAFTATARENGTVTDRNVCLKFGVVKLSSTSVRSQLLCRKLNRARTHRSIKNRPKMRVSSHRKRPSRFVGFAIFRSSA